MGHIRDAFSGRLAPRPAWRCFAGGLAAFLLTPFVFFPEILGGAGVRHASLLRNAGAVLALVSGAFAMLLGLVSLAHSWRAAPADPAQRNRANK